MENGNQTCYLCGSRDHAFIHKGVRGADDIDVYRCNKCGLTFLSKFMDNADEFYEASNMRAKKQSIDFIRRTTWRDDERRYSDFRSAIENKNILDFGCGAGGFLNLAKKTAGRITGIELENSVRKDLIEDGIDCFASIDECEKYVLGGYEVRCNNSISCP